MNFVGVQVVAVWCPSDSCLVARFFFVGGMTTQAVYRTRTSSAFRSFAVWCFCGFWLACFFLPVCQHKRITRRAHRLHVVRSCRDVEMFSVEPRAAESFFLLQRCSTPSLRRHGLFPIRQSYSLLLQLVGVGWENLPTSPAWRQIYHTCNLSLSIAVANVMATTSELRSVKKNVLQTQRTVTVTMTTTCHGQYSYACFVPTYCLLVKNGSATTYCLAGKPRATRRGWFISPRLRSKPTPRSFAENPLAWLAHGEV